MTVSHSHGYADEEGNVFLNSADGPVKLGQYVAGTPEEGVSFFARKYNDLVSEIELAIARLRDGKANPDAAKALLEKIEAAITTPSMLGDLSIFHGHKTEIEELTEKARAQVAEKKAAAKAMALARREEIVALAESLVNSNQWKSTGEKFKELLDEWKTLQSGDRGKEQELWKRFSHSRTVFDKARRNYFQNLDVARTEALQAKNALIKKAEALADSTDWVATGNAFKGLMAEWKVLPRTGRGSTDSLWDQFKTLQDKFFDARSKALSARDEEFGGNLTIKLSLLEKAEALLPITDVDAAKTALRNIQEQWEKAGHVPRGDKEKIERRLKNVEDSIRKVQEQIWHRSKPEVIDRANGLVTQFEASLAKLDKQIATAQAAGKSDELARLTASREQVEALLAAARDGAATLG